MSSGDADVKARTAGSSGTAPRIAERREADARRQRARPAPRCRPTRGRCPPAPPSRGEQSPSASSCEARRARAGAERRADGELALPRGGLREQQVRDVDARDQQDECDGAEQRDERRREAVRRRARPSA